MFVSANCAAGGLAERQDAGARPHGVGDARRHGPEHPRRHHARVPLRLLPRADHHRPAGPRHRRPAGEPCRSIWSINLVFGCRCLSHCTWQLGLWTWRHVLPFSVTAGVAGHQLRPAAAARELPAPHRAQRAVRAQGCRHQLRVARRRAHAQGHPALLQHRHRGAALQRRRCVSSVKYLHMVEVLLSAVFSPCWCPVRLSRLIPGRAVCAADLI